MLFGDEGCNGKERMEMRKRGPTMSNGRLEEKEGQTERCARQRAGVAKAGTEQAGPVQAHPELVPWGPTNDQPKFRDAAGLDA